MPPPGFVSVTVAESTLQSVKSVTDSMELKQADFVARCVKAVVEMAKQERGRRAVPVWVKLVGAALEGDEIAVEPKKGESVADVASSVVGEILNTTEGDPGNAKKSLPQSGETQPPPGAASQATTKKLSPSKRSQR